jgi:PKD repeat protein
MVVAPLAWAGAVPVGGLPGSSPAAGPPPASLAALEAVRDRLDAKLPVDLLQSPTDEVKLLLDVEPRIQRIIDGDYRLNTVIINNQADCDAQVVSGVITVTDDWRIEGACTLSNVEILFTGNFIWDVVGTGQLTISGASTLRDLDDDRATGGVIRSTGQLYLIGNGPTPGQLLTVRSTSVLSLARGSNDFPPSTIRHVEFSDGGVGLGLTNSATVVEFNIFNNLETGISFIAPGTLAGATLTVTSDNTFVGNRVAVFYAAGTTSGTVQRSEFQANGFGVLCQARGPSAADQPKVRESNFRNNYAEAWTGLVGVQVLGVTVIPNSRCTFDGNYIDGDSTWNGPDDTVSNTQPNPVPTGAPAQTLVPEVITTTTSRNNPTLTRPLIVDNGGQLTITGTVNPNGFYWGSGTDGRIIVNGVTVVNNGVLFIRNDNDQVNGFTADGEGLRSPLFNLGATRMHIFQYRNSATVDQLTLTNFQNAIHQVSGLFQESQTPRNPRLTNSQLRDGVYGVFGNGVNPTATNTVFERILLSAHQHQLGAVGSTFNDNTCRNVRLCAAGVIQPVQANRNTIERSLGGVIAALGAITMDGNNLRAVEVGAQQQLASITSTNDRFDGGLAAVISVLGSATITSALVAQQNFGVLTAIDTSFSVTGSTFAYNAYAVASFGSQITVQNSNFRDNYQFSLFAMPIALEADTFTPTSITCTNCFFFRPDDDSRHTGGQGTITVTPAAAANPAPNPPWLANVIIADGTEVVVPSGTLVAPAISRANGRLVLDGVTVDGVDRFAIGAKTRGSASHAPGHVSITGSTLSNLRFVSVQDLDEGSVIEQNVFQSSAELIEVGIAGMTIACNQFQNVSLPVNWMRQDAGRPKLVYTRNLHLAGTGLAVPPLDWHAAVGGIDLGFADTDRQAADVLDNGYIGGGAASGLVDRFQPGHVEFHGNNLLTPTGLRELNLGFVTTNLPDAVEAQGNWWNAASGPTIASNLGGTGAAILFAASPNIPPPEPVYNPFLGAPNTVSPCVGFVRTPRIANEVTEVTFRDRSFAPSGLGIVERRWSWGDGSPDTVTPDEVTTHTFTDGGTFTVTLTVETAGGETGSLSRQVTIAHVAPVADFSAAVLDETQPVQFTDTSTHPNGADAPPTGWTYAWDFNNDGVTDSANRNPSFTYADGGTKTARLTVTDNDGLSHSVTKQVNVPHVAPLADFGVVAVDEATPVQFTDVSTHPNAADAPPTGWTYAWNFNGEGTSSQRNPTFTFPDGGTKTVSLTVTDNDGLSHSTQQVIQLAHVAPNANFAATVQAPGQVQFTDTSTHAKAGDAPPAGWTYSWDFDTSDGIGTDSAARNPFHDYGVEEGVFTARLTVTDNDGQTSFKEVTVDVAVQNALPQANFRITPTIPQAGSTATFTDQSQDEDGSIVEIIFEPGDGSPAKVASGPNVQGHAFQHTYAAGGNYLVNWTVTDDRGAVATLQRDVYVCQPPGKGIIIGPGLSIQVEICTGQSI